MHNVTLKEGDLAPHLSARLEGGNPSTALNLTGCAVRLRYTLQYLGVTFDRPAAIVGDPTAGQVEYVWQVGDTALPGVYQAEWVVIGPDAKPLTVPNGLYFEIRILANVQTAAYGVLKDGSQTALLLRRLRGRLADTQRVLYTEDNMLVQVLLDLYEEFLVEVQETPATVTLYAPAAPGYDAADPLLTAPLLPRRNQDLWVLLAARELVEAEILAASRIAASIRTPAGQQNLQEVHRALRACLEDLEAALQRRLNEGGGGLLSFVDLATLDGRVVEGAELT